MAIDFPANPTNGQVYGNWIYDSSITAWRNVNTDSGIGTLNAMGLKNVVPTSISVSSGSATVNANGTVTFTSAPSISLNGCFSSTYKKYRIVVNTESSAQNADLALRLRQSGTDTSTGYFQGGQYVTFTGSANSYSFSNTNAIFLTNIATDANRPTIYSLDMAYPNVATGTTWTGSGYGNRGGVGPCGYTGAGFTDNTTQFTGLTILGSGGMAITGDIQVFGYNQ